MSVSVAWCCDYVENAMFVLLEMFAIPIMTSVIFAKSN
jgi:hypothetical protein